MCTIRLYLRPAFRYLIVFCEPGFQSEDSTRRSREDLEEGESKVPLALKLLQSGGKPSSRAQSPIFRCEAEWSGEKLSSRVRNPVLGLFFCQHIFCSCSIIFLFRVKPDTAMYRLHGWKMQPPMCRSTSEVSRQDNLQRLLSLAAVVPPLICMHRKAIGQD